MIPNGRRPAIKRVCTVLSEPPLRTTERADIVSVLEAFYDAHNTHSPASAGELYASDCVHWEVAQGRGRTGRDEIRQGLETFLTAFPDACWEPRTCTLAPGQAAVSYTLTGSLQEALGGISPTGQRLELAGVHIFWIGDGRIERVEDYWDAASFMSQMRKPAL
jgi:steroid delta-isomerase-like uncharacterized protein